MINGRKEEGVWVAHLAPNPYTNLPFILNATNRKRIVKLFPDCDGYLARLENIPVRLTKEKCRDVNDGGETWGLRISKIPASAAAPDTPAQKKVVTEDKVDAIVDWAKKKGYGFEKVADIYGFESDTVRDAIIDALKPVEDMPE
jgi:hypothetical protein